MIGTDRGISRRSFETMLTVRTIVTLWLVVTVTVTVYRNDMSVDGFTTTPSMASSWRISKHRPSEVHDQMRPSISVRNNAASDSRLRRPYFLSPSCRSRTELRATPLSAITTGIKTLHSNPSYVAMSVLWLSSFGIAIERRTVVGKALSAPLATMALALTVANVGVIPFQSSVYSFVNRYLVALAVPLLLFDSDLRRVIKDTGTLLVAFAVGALATVVGTLVALPIVPLGGLGKDVGWRVACALTARHIGGAINFVAVAETLDIGANAVAAAIAADNIVVALYFAFLFYIAKPGEGDTTDLTAISRLEMIQEEQSDIAPIDKESSIAEMEVEEGAPSSITLPSLLVSISVASSLVTAGSLLTKSLLPSGTSSLPLISSLTVAAATAFPTFFSKLSQTGTALGVIFVQMFFACSGAAGSIRMVFQQAPALFAFSALQICVHFGVLMTIGRGIVRLPNRELYLASNANVGGPTTAAAMAQAKEWKRLVLPALLIGILGYATATGIALSLCPLLLKLPPC